VGLPEGDTVPLALRDREAVAVEVTLMDPEGLRDGEELVDRVTDGGGDCDAPMDQLAEGVVEASTTLGCATGEGNADGLTLGAHIAAQSVLPRALNLPAGHARHAPEDVAPVAVLYFPLSHGSHTGEPATL
jgi:hypothetical protein